MGKILIIDDEELIVRTLYRILKREGYEVYFVKRGEESISLVEYFKDINLIIADIRMPGINGVETIRLIKDKLKVLNRPDIPVIFITGYADEIMEKEAKALKPMAFIVKPFDIFEFIKKVKEILPA